MRFLLWVMAAAPLLGQSWYPRHNFHFGAGAGRPRGELSGPLLDSAAVSVGYGYRFQRYLQVDSGVDTLLGAARIRDFLETRFGPLRIRDYQFLVPFGVRGILPLERGRFLVSAGAGGIYLRYAERIRQPSEYFRIDCPVCAARDGWGYYGLVNASLFFDRARHFRFGVTGKVYQGHTDGDPLGFIPGIRTRDRWVGIFGEFGVSF